MPRSSYKFSKDVYDAGPNEDQKYRSTLEMGEVTFQDTKDSTHTGTKDTQMVGAGQVFRFATCKDRLLMVLGTIGACIHGASRPALMILFGTMADMFIDDSRYGALIDAIMPNLTAIMPNITKDWIIDNQEEFMKILINNNATVLIGLIENAVIGDLLDRMQEFAIIYCIVGCCILLAAYMQMVCWQTAAFNQGQHIRQRLIYAILRQDIGWFDTHETGQLNSRLADDVDQVESGIGDKLCIVVQHLSCFIAGFVVAFVYGWKLALVILAVVPLMALVGGIANRMGTSWTKRELQAYAKAGAVAEEVLGSIRTVVAFGGQHKESLRYSNNLTDARDMGYKKGIINAAGVAIAYMTLFGSYALAFWYGSQLVTDGELTPGNLITVFFSIMMGGFSIGNAAPNLQDFANSRGAAYAVYNIIDLVPSIDSSSPEGKKPKDIKGNIEFKEVFFTYPSRKNVKVLEGLSFRASVGETVALVGSSGCGKSTTVQLLQRFYDSDKGQVLIDGTDIREFNIKWLRQHIGVVSQEPVLFGTTIAENICFGKEGTTLEEIVQAAKMANAHNFIIKLPNKYETVIGDRGTQLSGGQKQRIAIARALVRDPKILLLDEATSALDTESEATVQEALDKARQGRTTIVVAHRLSTIKTANVIVGIEDGKAVEQGTHEQLMQNPQGVYYKLVTHQTKYEEKERSGEVPELMYMQQMELQRADSGAYKHRTLSATSTTSSLHDGKDSSSDDETQREPELRRLMQLNAPEWFNILIACLAAIVAGGVQPASAVIYTEILSIFKELDPDILKKETTNLALMYLVLGAVASTAMAVMLINFAISGESLTMRLRSLAFKSMLRQDMSYFDDLKNSTGALCTRLASDASLVKGATGIRMATTIQSLSSLGAGLAIGFVYSWKLTLLVLAFVPFIMFAGLMSVRTFSGGKQRKSNPLENSGKVAVEAIENIRTVASLTKEEHFAQLYCNLISIPYNNKRKSAQIQSFGHGCSFSILFFCYAACYTLGAYLIDTKELQYEDMFRVIACVIFGAQGAGQATHFGADYGKAKAAAVRLFALFDLQPKIDSYSEEGFKKDTIGGSVELNNVRFNYPTRPNVPVLRGTSFTVEPGQTVALVGASGCGKSTVVQLLERFYDPLAGLLKVDGKDIREYNMQWLRSQISIVSQEPVLFDCNIRENIAYGDNSKELPMDEIIEAARQANIHNFIQSLPQGYDTNVGDKGTQLSGGQKQRVAIARALVRNPKILLLDEATSALDTESEKVVQEALDRAQEGRTSLVIAHRLSTIQNAHCILVMHNGKVAESGTHSQLLQLGRIYYNLNIAQLHAD